MSENAQPVLALLSEGILDTDYGKFRISVFHDGNEQAIVLSKGELGGQKKVLCRIHSECITSHVFFGKECDCRKQMMKSQEMIQANGQGIIIFLAQEGRGNGAAAHVATLNLKREGKKQSEAYKLKGFPRDTRDYNIVPKILHFLQIESVILFTSNRNKIECLREAGIKVEGTKYLEDEFTTLGKSLNTLANNIKEGTHFSNIKKDKDKKFVFVIGDLNVDYLISQRSIQDGILDKPKPIVGGTGFNAAMAFRKKDFEPIIFGKIGNDMDGRLIRSELEKNRITSLVDISEDKHTGNCHVVFIEDEQQRWIIKEENNANDYDLKNLRQALELSNVEEGDFIFVVAHFFVRFDREYSKALIETMSDTGAKIVLDIVPHNMYKKITIDDFNYIVGDKVETIIGEYFTLMRFVNDTTFKQKPTDDDWSRLLEHFKSETIVARYGVGNISHQTIVKRRSGGYQIIDDTDTGYSGISVEKKRGFGDILTADFFEKVYS